MALVQPELWAIRALAREEPKVGKAVWPGTQGLSALCWPALYAVPRGDKPEGPGYLDSAAAWDPPTRVRTETLMSLYSNTLSQQV